MKKKLIIVIFIVILNSIGFSIVLPLLPFLIEKYLPSNYISFGVSSLVSVYALFTFISSPILGSFSDKYGRKIILLISIFGSVIGFILFGIGGAFWVLLISRIIDGLTAGNISVLFAYVADITQPTERGKWFGYIGAAMGIGKIGGPILGGFLGGISISLPFYLTSFFLFLSLLGVYYFLPESLLKERRNNEIDFKKNINFFHFKDLLDNRNIILHLLIGLLFYIGIGVFQFNFTIFLKDFYSLSPLKIGYLFTLIGIFEIFSRSFLLQFLIKRISELKIGFIGLIFFLIGLILIIASIYFHFIAIIIFSIILIISGEGLFEPIYLSALSNMTSVERQGELIGLNQSLQSVNNIALPFLVAFIYYYSCESLYLFSIFNIVFAIFLYSKKI